MMKDRWRFIMKSGLKVAWILYVLLSIVFWLPRVDQLLCKDYQTISKHVSLDEQWDILINDSAYHDITLTNFQFPSVNKDDKIIMERVLPDDWGIVEGALRLHIRQTAVKMYIDDEVVYEYGYERAAQNKTVGSGFQFINFPEEYQGKTLRIELYVLENHAFTRLDSIRIYEWQNAYRALLTENRMPMFFGSFLAIFGLAMVMITMVALVFSKKYIKMFCISAFSICMGLWTLCYNNVILVYSIPLYSVSLIEYMALYLAPIPLMIYMHENVSNLKSKVIKAVYWILLVAQIAFNVVILTLHTMDIVHCAAVLKYMQAIIVCSLIYFILVLILNLKFSGLINRLYLVGLLIIAVCVGYDLISYSSERYWGYSFLTLKGVSSIGVMVFIFILIATFYIDITEKMMQEAERNSLIKSAYTDELTQVYNRRYCSEHMKKINDEKGTEYSVICFDVNNLKTVNDTYGHSKGDVLIKCAADTIAGIFQKYGVVGRMGGDEFIAILNNSHKEEIEALLEQFRADLTRKNQEMDDMNISIAYGYALSGEIEGNNIEKIYQIADDRMYENKKQYKSKISNKQGQNRS